MPGDPTNTTEPTGELIPDEAYVHEGVSRLTGLRCSSIARFPTGLAHFVFDVECTDGSKLVARLTSPENRDQFVAALHWSETLRALGLPLPELLASALDGQWPVLLLERLPGTDLQNVFLELNAEQRTALAGRVANIQRNVHSLPEGTGYGYARSHADPDLYPAWIDILIGQIERSRERIASTGFVEVSLAHHVLSRITGMRDRLDGIPPTPFLDDTTTKNVIIHEGRLSGIVDVDWVCFGDPIFAIALTRVAILSRGWDAQYVEDWFGFAGYGESDRWRLNLYTSIHALGFLSEYGQSFNSATPMPPDPETINRLLALI